MVKGCYGYHRNIGQKMRLHQDRILQLREHQAARMLLDFPMMTYN
jgi:hypothetical protein